MGRRPLVFVDGSYPWYDRETGRVDRLLLLARATQRHHKVLPEWMEEIAEFQPKLRPHEAAALDGWVGRRWRELQG